MSKTCNRKLREMKFKAQMADFRTKLSYEISGVSSKDWPEKEAALMKQRRAAMNYIRRLKFECIDTGRRLTGEEKMRVEAFRKIIKYVMLAVNQRRRMERSEVFKPLDKAIPIADLI